MFRKLLALLPKIEIGMADFYLHVSVGETPNQSVGFTVGPRFLSLDMKGDIARMLISPPEGHKEPFSDITFTWNTREGLVDLHVPSITINHIQDPDMAHNFDTWAKDAHAVNGRVEEEEPVPSTIRTYMVG